MVGKKSRPNSSRLLSNLQTKYPWLPAPRRSSPSAPPMGILLPLPLRPDMTTSFLSLLGPRSQSLLLTRFAQLLCLPHAHRAHRAHRFCSSSGPWVVLSFSCKAHPSAVHMAGFPTTSKSTPAVTFSRTPTLMTLLAL